MKHILAKAAAFALAGALALSLAACGAKIDSVSLPGALRLEKGETALLTPASAPASQSSSEPAGGPASYTVASSGPVNDVARVSAGEDDAVVLTATTHVTVTTRVESLAFDRSEGTLTIGSTATMKVSVLPETASDQAIT